jgi:hypothetical protein
MVALKISSELEQSGYWLALEQGVYAAQTFVDLDYTVQATHAQNQWHGGALHQAYGLCAQNKKFLQWW